MTYNEAKTLEVGEGVKVKKTGEIIVIDGVEHMPSLKTVFVHTEDGEVYEHKQLAEF